VQPLNYEGIHGSGDAGTGGNWEWQLIGLWVSALLTTNPAIFSRVSAAIPVFMEHTMGSGNWSGQHKQINHKTDRTDLLISLRNVA